MGNNLVKNLIQTSAFALSLAVSSAIAPTANAASISYSNSIANYELTNWTKQLSLPKFDSSLGTLTGIQYELTGDVSGLIGFEDLSSPTVINDTLNITLALLDPVGDGSLVEITPSVTYVDSVKTSDGSVNFERSSRRTYFLLEILLLLFFGSSGRNHSSSPLRDSNQLSLNATAVKLVNYDPSYASWNSLTNLVAGSDNLWYDLAAIENIQATGADNVIVWLTNETKGSITVTYLYDENVVEVPEPETYVATALALGLGLLFKKKVTFLQKASESKFDD